MSLSNTEHRTAQRHLKYRAFLVVTAHRGFDARDYGRHGQKPRQPREIRTRNCETYPFQVGTVSSVNRVLDQIRLRIRATTKTSFASYRDS